MIIAAPSPEEIERAVRDELALPKYRLADPWWGRLGEWLEQAWIRLLEAAGALAERVGGPVVLALLIAVAVVALTVAVVSNLGRRRARVVTERARQHLQAVRGLDPADLERGAALAEETGDHAAAMRLLFLALLIRLDRAERIDLGPASTSASIADQLRSPGFAEAAARFDEVVYGGRPAGPHDPARVRAIASQMLAEARR